MKLKVGDYITCIKTGKMTQTDEVFAIEGNQYKVTHVMDTDCIQIHSEICEYHNWYTNDESFKEYFCDDDYNGVRTFIPRHKFR